MRNAIVRPEVSRHRWLSAMVSTAILVTALVGVPLALVVLGRGTVGWDQVRELLHRSAPPVSSSTLMQAALDVGAIAAAWLCWAWFATCVAVEVRVALRGGVPILLPGSRSLQNAAALLITGVLAVAGGMRCLERSGGPVLTLATLATPFAPDVAPATRFAVADSAIATDTATATVGVGASRARREDVAPASFRTTKPNGGEFSLWTLETETATGSGSELAQTASDTVHVVAHRETLWSLAEAHFGDGTQWPLIAEANYGVVQADGGSLGRDHWIVPGWHLRLPVKAWNPSDRSESSRTDGVHPDPVVPVDPVGAGVIGVGVTDLLERWRRGRNGGQVTGGSPGQRRDPAWLHRMKQLERRLYGSVDRANRDLDDARAAVATWQHVDGDSHPVVCVRVTPGEVVLGLRGATGAVAAPLPFRAVGRDLVYVDRNELCRGGGWRDGWLPLGPPDRIPGHTPRRWHAGQLPTLVALGHGADSTETVFLDVVAARSVLVEADARRSEGIARALALELATTADGPRFRLLLIGFGEELTRFPHVDMVDAGDVATGNAMGTLLDHGDGGHLTVPRIVVCSPHVPTSVLRHVAEVARQSPSLGVVAFAAPENRRQDGDQDFSVVLRLESTAPASDGDGSHTDRATGQHSVAVFGTAVDPQEISSGELSSVVDLLTAALGADTVRTDDLADEPADDPERAGRREREEHTSAPAIPFLATPPKAVLTLSASPPRDDGIEIVVAVLGPVEVRGAARAFTRAWSKELVAYLALHPDGATADVWSTALWPEKAMAAASLHSTVSVARRALGTSASGTDHLPRVHGRLRLAPTVGTDWQDFCGLSATDDPDDWHAALELVRGRVLDGLRGTDWAVLDGTLPMIEAAIVETSGRLAGACFRKGDPAGMEWAARRGLVVSPYDERLYRMLMRASDLAGNPAGVEAVMAELLRVTGDGANSVTSVHPSTLALYRELSRRPSSELA